MPGPSWIVLGAGSALPRVGYGPAGYALRPAPGRRVTLFDCGPGTIRSLAAAGVSVSDVERVVISHFHADHFLDLFALAFARSNPDFRGRAELELIGPRGLAERLAGGVRTLGQSVAFAAARVIEVEVSEVPRALEVEGLSLASVGTRHTDTSLAWRARLPTGESVTYTGDTREVPEVARLAAGTDLFVAECSHADAADASNHLSPSSAARLARDAGAARLLLTHFYPDIDPAEARRVAMGVFPGPVDLARDGRVFPLRSPDPDGWPGSV